MIGNEADGKLREARWKVKHARSKSDIDSKATVGATIGYHKSSWPYSMFSKPELRVLMVGERVAIDGVGANPNNIGGMDSHGSLAIYVNESNKFDYALKYGGDHYQGLANAYNTSVVLEVHYRWSDSRAEGSIGSESLIYTSTEHIICHLAQEPGLEV